MSFLENIHWRYATKKFDPTQKVSDADIEKILEAIRLTPTSFGLQPYHFYVVTNHDIKNQIQSVAWNQPQVGTSSHLIVFTVRTDLVNTKNEFFELLSGGNEEIRKALKGYEDMVDGSLASRDEASLVAWATRQVYIAHGFALAAAAELKIDSCAMEGADFDTVGKILGLPENHKAVVMLPLGYRDPSENPRPKARFSKESLFTEVK